MVRGLFSTAFVAHTTVSSSTFSLTSRLQQWPMWPQDNPNYVGRFSRIGMGLVDDKGRCITHGVHRALNAADTVAALGVSSGEQPPLSIVVTRPDSEQQLDEDEYKQLPGFEPSLFWGNLGEVSGISNDQNEDGSGCCSVS